MTVRLRWTTISGICRLLAHAAEVNVQVDEGVDHVAVDGIGERVRPLPVRERGCVGALGATSIVIGDEEDARPVRLSRRLLSIARRQTRAASA